MNNLSNYRNVGEGLQKMRTAAIGAVICGFLSPMPVVGTLFQIGIIVFFVIDIIGYYKAGKDLVACKIAFIFVILTLILDLVGLFLPLSGIMDTVGSLLSFAAISLVFFSVSHVLRKNGEKELAKKGIIAWVVYLVSIILSFVLEIINTLIILSKITSQGSTSVLSFMTESSGLGTTLLMLVLQLAISIVALVFQLKFYKAAAEEFGAYF